MKNIVLIISTLQECDAFFSFASGLKDKNKNLNIITFIDDPECFEELKRNKSLFLGYKKIGTLIGRERKKNKISQKFYNFFWMIKLVLIIKKFENTILFSSEFYNIYRNMPQIFCRKKALKPVLLMPHSMIWNCQYEELKRRIAKYKFYKKSFRNEIFNLKPKGYMYYNYNQLPYANYLKKNYKFEKKQICCSGLGTETNFYINFFNKEYKKNSKKLSFFKKGSKKNIFSIIAAAHGPYLLKNDSQDRILKKILIGIMECNKNSIILIRTHPKSNKNYFLKIFKDLKIKKNIYITKLHPQILARASNRIIFYARTNIMTDIFRTKMIDCTEYKKEDLNKHIGYGIIYVHPQKKNFEEKFKKVLLNDNFFLNKKIYSKEKEFIKNNKFKYQKVESFLKTNIL